MSGSYTIDSSRRLVLSRGWGVVTSDELLRHVKAVAADPAFDPSYRQLADVRKSSGMDFNVATIRELSRLNPFGPTSRRAIVLTSDTAYAVIRMYLLFRGSNAEHVRVFHEMSPAMEWLELSDADAAAVTEMLNAPPVQNI